jgi:hypothetical protein
MIVRLKRALALTAATLAMGAAALVASTVSPAPASAEEVGTQALAPPCVTVSLRTGFLVEYEDVRNLCGRVYRVKVIVAWGPDSACHTLYDGQGFTHTHGVAGRFDRLELC